MPTITKSGSKITVGAMMYESKSIAKNIFDLKGHEGERVRVYIGNDYRYNIETISTQELLVCELDIPEKQYEHTKTTEKDDRGEYVIETTEKELKLEEVEMKEYLKEVK